MSRPTDLVQGTLDLLILKTVALQPLHGLAIAHRIRQLSREVLLVQQGTLYPALHKLEAQGYLKAAWGESDLKRRAKYLLAHPRRAEAARRRAAQLGAAVHRRDPGGEGIGGVAMRPLRMLWFRLKALLFRNRMDRELDEELRFHLDVEAAGLTDRGVSAADAARRVRLNFGGPTQVAELSRESRGIGAWDSTVSDLRYAGRQIRRRPMFAATAIATLALGLGVTTVMVAIVDAVLIRPLPLTDAERLYSLYEVNSRANIGRTRATALNFLDWKAQSRAFSDMAGHIGTGFTFTGRGDADFVLGQLVTPNLFDVLGVQPIIGRGFREEETEAGHSRVVVLSHALFLRKFGGDRAIVGQHLVINNQSYLVAGVMGPTFQFPSRDYQLWAPLVTRGALPDGPPMTRSARYLRVVARLAPGATEQQAREEMSAVGKRLAAAFPDANATVSVGLTSLSTEIVGDTGDSLMVVLIAVGFVLLICAINVAGLTLARGTARGREIAIRAAIGASRRRIVRQLVTESLLIYTIAGALGLTLAWWAQRWIVSVLPATMPRVSEIAIDWRIVAFSAAITVVMGVLFSILPALATAHRRLSHDLVGTGRTVSPGRGTVQARAVLIVAQIAAAIVLLAGAGLALRSFDRVLRTDKGFDSTQTLTFRFVLTSQRYPSAADVRQFIARTTESLGVLPGVVAAGATTHLPLADNNFENTFTVEGSAPPDGADPPLGGVRGVAGAYRAAIGARLLTGRDLSASDTESATPVVLVTESFAARHIPGRDPLGLRIKMGGADSGDPWRTIVGVIADIRHTSLDQPSRPEVWLPQAQMPGALVTRWLRGMGMAVRTANEPTSLTGSIRSAMRDLDRDLPLVTVQTLDELASESTADRRLETWLLGGFAATAATLAAIGLFGVLAFYVAQHVREFGVRLALGATPSQLMRLVLRRGLVLLGLGLAIGVPAAMLMGRAMRAVLYETAPADPAVLTAAVSVLTIVTLVAAMVPARRAMHTDPLVALRDS